MVNPIIRKEVLMTLRTSKALVMQVAYLVALAGLMWLYWPADGLQDIGGEKARQILSILAIGELALVALFAPAFTGAAMTMEKEKKTFESLFATRLLPRQIALGKMVGSLAFLVLVVLSGIPALAAPLMLGGLSGYDVLKVALLLVLTAIYLGSIGLLISTVMHRSYRAIILTYAVILVVFFITALPAWSKMGGLIQRCGPAGQAILTVIASFSPLEAMISIVWPGSVYDHGGMSMPHFWMLHVPLACAVVVGVALFCIYKLGRPMAPPRPREKLKVIERDGKITARSFMFLIDPRKRKQMISWWQNPILIKEFRTRPMLQTHRLLRAAGFCLIASFLLMFAVLIAVNTMVGEEGTKTVMQGGKQVETVAMIPAITTAVGALMVVVIILIGPAMASGAISSDRETGVWELIRSTRMSSLRIASGKFQASIIPLLLVVGAMAPSLVVPLYVDPTVWPNVLRVLAVVGMTIFFVSTAGTFFSSLFARTSTATAWTYGLVISLGLASLLAMLGGEKFSDGFIRTIFLVNPVASVMDAGGNETMQRYSLWAEHIRIVALAGVGMFVVTVGRILQLRRPE